MKQLRTLIVGLAIALPSASPLVAQDTDEPVLDDVLSLLQRPGFNLGTLFQAVIDPGLDGARESVDVAAARVLLRGQLDGGFEYFLQTNFAASPSVLDARVGWSAGPEFAVHAGRFKTPFSRELLTFAGSIDFVNRARAVNALAPNRQRGVQISGAAGEYLRWAAGGFTGASSTLPNEPLIGVLRIHGEGLELADGTLDMAVQIASGRDAAIAARTLPQSFGGTGTLFGVDWRFEGPRLLLAGEILKGDWETPAGAAVDASGLYVTAGWMVREGHQALVRWDRLEAPGVGGDDVAVLGYNTWPTRASEIQVNLALPMRGSTSPYSLLVNFQVGF